jgi:hypothetical protein
MPAVWIVMDARPADDAVTRARRFQHAVIEACPALQGAVVPANADFDVTAYLAPLGTLLPTMRDLDGRTRAQVDASLASMRERFGRLGDMSDRHRTLAPWRAANTRPRSTGRRSAPRVNSANEATYFAHGRRRHDVAGFPIATRWREVEGKHQ